MKYLFLFAAVAVAFSSCCIEGKMETVRNALTDTRKQQELEKSRMMGMRNLSASKLAQGHIDSIIESRVANKLYKYNRELLPTDLTIVSIDSLLGNKKGFRRRYKNYILPNMDSMKVYTEAYGGRSKLYEMVEDGLNISKYQLFDLAAFFGPGKYAIPDDKAALAQASFAPIIDSVVAFAKKYNVPSTASLVILGFADGTGFSNQGPLFDTLTSLIGRRDATKEEMNLKLSELRAGELIKHLTHIYDSKVEASVKEKSTVEPIGVGKGEAYPLPTIKDYSVDDPRRRIVLCYWIVLPN